jgi:RNA 2',3'-cyclic 3'-phosphodiesterase
MAGEQQESPKARMFVALDIPDWVRSEIGEWGRKNLADPVLRPVSGDSLHITLCFLGSRPESEVERLAGVLRAVASRALQIELRGPVARPRRGRPRFYALEVRSPQTVTLQALLHEGLIMEGLLEPEKRAFWPHLTVARVRSEAGRRKRPMRVTRPPGLLPETLKQVFGGVRVTLYRSKLQPQGAEYTPLAQVELSEEGGGEVETDG